MLKSCKYCGRIHDVNYECSKKHKSVKKLTYIDRFRNTRSWKNKREEIKDRDNHLCQICIRKLFEFKQMYNYSDLQVHHAIPIHVDYDRRLDNDNLITLCPFHHKMAEDGKIPYLLIKTIIDEQEGIPPTFRHEK